MKKITTYIVRLRLRVRFLHESERMLFLVQHFRDLFVHDLSKYLAKNRFQLKCQKALVLMSGLSKRFKNVFDFVVICCLIPCHCPSVPVASADSWFIQLSMLQCDEDSLGGLRIIAHFLLRTMRGIIREGKGVLNFPLPVPLTPASLVVFGLFL